MPLDVLAAGRSAVADFVLDVHPAEVEVLDLLRHVHKITWLINAAAAAAPRRAGTASLLGAGVEHAVQDRLRLDPGPAGTDLPAQ